MLTEITGLHIDGTTHHRSFNVLDRKQRFDLGTHLVLLPSCQRLVDLHLSGSLLLRTSSFCLGQYRRTGPRQKEP